jgi:DNA-binding transcriptional MerR regulator
MNTSTAENAVQWLFLDLNAFFASCEQQENPVLRGQPVIVVQTLTDSAVAIAASYAAKAFGIKTGTLMREARQLCPAVIPVQANHRLYTEYHERILKAVDTCLPVEKVCSIDEMACRLMGTERQVAVARELAVKVKRALREQVGECLTCSVGIAPNVFLGKVGSDLQKPDGLVVITNDDLPEILLGLELQDIYGIGSRMEQRLHRAGILTVAQLWNATPHQLRRVWGGRDKTRGTASVTDVMSRLRRNPGVVSDQTAFAQWQADVESFEKSEHLTVLRGFRNFGLAHRNNPNLPDPRSKSNTRRVLCGDACIVLEGTIPIVQQAAVLRLGVPASAADLPTSASSAPA